MGKSVLKITFDPHEILGMIDKNGFSIKSMAQKVGRAERTFRHYLDAGMMPVDVFEKMMTYIRDAESNDNVARINQKISELSELGLDSAQIMNEVSKSLAGVHPNMIDDQFVIHREVRFV